MNRTTRTIIAAAAIAGMYSGALVARASANVANAGTVIVHDDDKDKDKGKHDCAGKNSCKGTGGCKTGDNGCKGQNSCKGKGGCASKDDSKDDKKIL
jgi:hypothetical protein